MTNLKRVARRLCSFSGRPPDFWPIFTEQAAAALEALRDPSDLMMSCGARWVETAHMAETPEHAAKMVYMSMIDAALGEKP